MYFFHVIHLMFEVIVFSLIAPNYYAKLKPDDRIHSYVLTQHVSTVDT